MKKRPRKIVQPGAPRDLTNVQGTDRIILSELSQRQRVVVADCVSRIQAAAKQVDELKQEYNRLIAMVMPDGATGLDLEKGIFYYEKPTPPTPPALVTENDSEGDEAPPE